MTQAKSNLKKKVAQSMRTNSKTKSTVKKVDLLVALDKIHRFDKDSNL